MVIVASNGGTLRHPTWWLNLESQPEAEVQVGRRKLRVRAMQATGAERERLWTLLTSMYPPYDDYQRRTTREIPVVVLQPLG
jgi:deazaflavin-dependent oxidoreductase (nitroreductase family)